MVDKGETFEEAAMREVEEEGQVKIKIKGIITIEYNKSRGFLLLPDSSPFVFSFYSPYHDVLFFTIVFIIIFWYFFCLRYQQQKQGKKE